MSRDYTSKLLDLIEEGALSYESILKEMLKYFSEDEIKRFCLDGFAGELEHLFEGVGK